MSNSTVAHMQNAGEHLGLARDHLVVGAADAAHSAADALREVKAEAGADVDMLVDRSKNLVQDMGAMIARRPWAAIGGALAIGYLMARMRARG